jgi:hypothetical protein
MTGNATSDQNLVKVYDSQGNEYRRAFGVFLAHTDQKVKATAWLEQEVNGLAARDVFIDAGAGTGTLTTWLGPRFRKTIAIEPNPSLRDELQTACPEAELLPVPIAEARPSSRADFVLCSHVFYFTDRARWAEHLRCLANWLQPAGVLAVALQNHGNEARQSHHGASGGCGPLTAPWPAPDAPFTPACATPRSATRPASPTQGSLTGIVRETQVMLQQDPGSGGLLGPFDWLKLLPFEADAASDRLEWAGLEAARYRAAPDSELHPPAMTHHRLVLFAQPPEELELLYEGVKRHRPPPAGAISLLPAGTPAVWRWSGHKDLLHVYLEPGLVGRVAAEAFDLDPARLAVPPLDGLDLPQIRAVMSAVGAELTAGSAGGGWPRSRWQTSWPST